MVAKVLNVMFANIKQCFPSKTVKTMKPVFNIANIGPNIVSSQYILWVLTIVLEGQQRDANIGGHLFFQRVSQGDLINSYIIPRKIAALRAASF